MQEPCCGDRSDGKRRQSSSGCEDTSWSQITLACPSWFPRVVRPVQLLVWIPNLFSASARIAPREAFRCPPRVRAESSRGASSSLPGRTHNFGLNQLQLVPSKLVPSVIQLMPSVIQLMPSQLVPSESRISLMLFMVLSPCCDCCLQSRGNVTHIPTMGCNGHNTPI